MTVLRQIIVIASASLICAGAAVPAAAQGRTCYRVVNVEPFDVLYIRTRKDHRSKPAGAIAPDHTAPIVSTGSCTPKNASRKRQWCPIEYFPLPNVSRKGFVKAYFIENAPCN